MAKKAVKTEIPKKKAPSNWEPPEPEDSMAVKSKGVMDIAKESCANGEKVAVAVVELAIEGDKFWAETGVEDERVYLEASQKIVEGDIVIYGENLVARKFKKDDSGK